MQLDVSVTPALQSGLGEDDKLRPPPPAGAGGGVFPCCRCCCGAARRRMGDGMPAIPAKEGS